MTIKAVLFDLDGTLADTALDLGGALNHLLRQKGLPEKSMAEIRSVASHGANALIFLGAGVREDDAHHAQWRTAYLAEYEHCFDRDTVLFSGINDFIIQLNQRGILWGIITNKPKTFTERLVPKLQFAVEPSVVVSGDTCSQAKPSVEPMWFACEKIGVSPQYCLYVGDAQRDIQAGRDSGMKTVLASWGYIADGEDTTSWGADFVAENVSDILKWLDVV